MKIYYFPSVRFINPQVILSCMPPSNPTEKQTLVECCIAIKEEYAGKSTYANKIAYRELLSDWKANPVVKDVLEARTTFAEEVMSMPRREYSPKRRAQLNQCIAHVEDINSIGVSAKYWALVGFLPMLAAGYKGYQIGTRRDFLKGIGILLGGFAGGLATGAGAWFIKAREIIPLWQRAYDEALYLDDVVKHVYNR